MKRTLLVAEGDAERALLDLLIAQDALVMPASTLIELTDGGYVAPMKNRNFANQYLNFAFDEPIDICVITDSLTEQLPVSRPFRARIAAIRYYVTRPEIEMVQLQANPTWMKQYERFKKRHRSEGSRVTKPALFSNGR